MKSTERVYRSVAHLEIDRLPAAPYGTTIEYEMKMVKYLGLDSLETMYKMLGMDIWRNRELPVYTGKINSKVYENRLTPWAECHSIDQVERYRFPAGRDFDITNMLRELEAHRDFAIITGTMPEGCGYGPYHLYLDMCGQENGFVFLKEQPKVAKAMIRRVTDYWIDYTIRVLDSGWPLIDIWQNSNDFGTQQNLAISPDDFREFFKPELKRLYAVAKEYGVLCMQHSCGAVEPIIEDFIELGADILNPIQVTAAGMDLAKLHKKYGERITFFGGIDTQQLLPHGPEKKIRQEVRKIKKMFQTGYILAPSQELSEDIPLEHAIAMFDENMKGTTE